MNYRYNVNIRQIENKDDLHYILDTWTRCHKSSIDNARQADIARMPKGETPYAQIDNQWYNLAQRQVISAILDNDNVLVSCDIDHSDQIYGYIVYSDNRDLHWIYVKYNFRNAGIATRLMLEAFADYDKEIKTTHKSAGIKYHRDRWNLNFDSTRLREISEKQ